MKRLIIGIGLLAVVLGICSNTRAAVVLQSATRSVAIYVVNSVDGTFQAQSAETTEFGYFHESFTLGSGAPSFPGYATANQTSDISTTRIIVDEYAYGVPGGCQASSLCSVAFSVIDNPQVFRCTLSYDLYMLGKLDLYDLTHSQWIFSKPGFGRDGKLDLLDGGTYLTTPVEFQVTLPVADYLLRANSIAITDEPRYYGRISLDLETVPEPSTLALLLTASIGGLVWWRRRS